jgi:hypothetical protein
MTKLEELKEVVEAADAHAEAAFDAWEAAGEAAEAAAVAYRAELDKPQEENSKFEELEEALLDMVGLFSADDMLLKGTHLRAALKQARAALVTCSVEASQRSCILNPPRTKLEELRAADSDAYARAAAFEAAYAALDADAFAAYQAELKKTKEQTNAN